MVVLKHSHLNGAGSKSRVHISCVEMQSRLLIVNILRCNDKGLNTIQLAFRFERNPSSVIVFFSKVISQLVSDLLLGTPPLLTRNKIRPHNLGPHQQPITLINSEIQSLNSVP